LLERNSVGKKSHIFCYIHRVSKNVPPSTCYNLDIHDPITIVFGRNVTEKVVNHMMLCFSTSRVICFCITLRNRKPGRQRTGALCVQHSPTAAALSTSFLLNHASNMRTVLQDRWIVSIKVEYRKSYALEW